MTWMSFNAPLPYPAFTFFISAHALSLIREKTWARKSHNKNISMTKTTGFKVLATPSYRSKKKGPIGIWGQRPLRHIKGDRRILCTALLQIVKGLIVIITFLAL